MQQQMFLSLRRVSRPFLNQRRRTGRPPAVRSADWFRPQHGVKARVAIHMLKIVDSKRLYRFSWKLISGSLASLVSLYLGMPKGCHC